MDLNDNSPSNFCSCGRKKSYSEEYDAYYCSDCNKWLEGHCGDEECDYCWARPPTPRE